MTTEGATTTALASDDITSAKKAISSYGEEIRTINGQLDTDIKALVGKGYLGDAATSFNSLWEQFRTEMQKAITDGDESVTSKLNAVLDLVAQLMDPVDPEIKNTNEQAMQTGTGTSN